MNKQQSIESLLETLSEALKDARVSYDADDYFDEPLKVAEKTLEALTIALKIEDDWRCREPHCAFKHNDRGEH